MLISFIVDVNVDATWRRRVTSLTGRPCEGWLTLGQDTEVLNVDKDENLLKNLFTKTKIMAILRTYDFSVSLWVHRSPVTKVHTLLCMNLWQQMPCEKQHEYPFYMKHRHAKSVKSSTSTWYYGKVWVTLVFTSAAFKSIFKSNNLVIQKVWRTDAAPKNLLVLIFE